MTQRHSAQRGFAAIAAIFLVVVLAALGGFMLTFSNTAQLTSAQDVQGTRAYWAARAGLEWAIAHSLASTPVTLTIAAPGVVTWVAHGLPAGTVVFLGSTGTLPTGYTAGTAYYVVNPPGVNTFQLALTAGGAAIATTGSQSGSQTAWACVAGPTTTSLGTIEGFSVSTTVSCDAYSESSQAVSIFRITSQATSGTVGSIGRIERSVSAAMER